MLGKIEGGRGGERHRMSWLNGHEFEQALGERKPGVLQSMWSQRVRQHWAAQQVWDFIALIAQMLEVSLCSCWLMARWLNCNNQQHLKDFWQQRCIIFWHCFNMWFFFSIHHAILQYQLGVLQLNSILTPPTWRQCQVPQVMGSVPQGCPPLLFCATSDVYWSSRLLPVLLTDWL